MTKKILKIALTCFAIGAVSTLAAGENVQDPPQQLPIEKKDMPTGVKALEAQQEALTKKKSALFQASFFDPVQIFSRKYCINGMRLNMFRSENISVNGLDIAACGLSSSRVMNGLQAGLATDSKDCNGLQIAAFATAPRKFNGMQLVVLDIPANETETFNGLRIDCIGIPCEIKQMNGVLIAGILNLCKKMNGFQFAYASINNESNGVQIAATFNQSDKTNGVQIGLFNYSDELSGVQIGVLNFAPGSWLPVSVGLNIAF